MTDRAAEASEGIAAGASNAQSREVTYCPASLSISDVGTGVWQISDQGYPFIIQPNLLSTYCDTAVNKPNQRQSCPHGRDTRGNRINNINK